MNEEQYKTYISSIINRLIDEKRVYPKIKKSNNSNKMEINILFSTTEWYHELDDDTKCMVEYNLKKIYTPIVINYMQDYSNNQNKLEQDNLETSNYSAKRLKVD
jgi:hypothetical protein